MFDFACHETIKGAVLDTYLSMGWFRIGNILFTTDSTDLNSNIEYPVYWLRYKVNEVRLCRKNTKLISANSQFSTECRPIELNQELQNLFSKYRNGIKFEINSTIEGILMDTTTFDTRVVEVRDNGQLIAAGLFDVGNASIEAIINFYDPAYKKYSLGKYLIISEYHYCLQNNYTYFYPGYYIPGEQLLSYKLFLDKGFTEVYLPEENKWIAFSEFISGYRPSLEQSILADI